MKKRMKKILALGLAAAMTFGMSATAMAAETAAPEQAVEAEADGRAAEPEADAADQSDAEETAPVTEDAAEEAAPVTEDAAKEAAPEEDATEAAAPEENAVEAGTIEAGEEASVIGAAPPSLNGIVQAEDGNYYYFTNGVIDTSSKTTLAPYGGSWWYINHGTIDWSFEGLCEYGGVEWYVKDGRVQFGYDGFVCVEYEDGWGEDWYYIRDGRVDQNYTDVVHASMDGVDGWYYVENGELGYGITVAHNSNGWWYIGEDGKVDFSYEGVADNDNGIWYIKNGQVDFAANGFWEETHKMENDKVMPYQYVITNGKVDESITGVYWTEVNKKWGWHGYYKGELASGHHAGMVLPNENGWWYINTYGDVDFSVEGVGYNDNGEWYVKNGQVDFSKNGIYDSGEDMDDYPFIAKIVNGKVDSNYTGVMWTKIRGSEGWYGFDQGVLSWNDVLANDQGWWYIGDDGKVDFGYTGVGHNINGTWYIKNGQVDFGFTGTIKDDDSDYRYKYIRNGKFDYYLEDVVLTSVDGEEAWWHVSDGQISIYDSDVACNSQGWWYIKGGKVDFSYEGVAYNDNGEWYIKGGQVDFGYTGFYELDKYTVYYVQNGKIDYDYSGVVQGTVHGENGWWGIEYGMVDFSYDIGYNENGTWYYENGKVDFDANGQYVVRQTVSHFDEDDEEIIDVDFSYILQVSGGLVTDVRVVSPDSKDAAV